MPRAGKGGFIPPTDGEKAAFTKIVEALEIGDVPTAIQIAEMNHYELIRYTDNSDENSTSFILREQWPRDKGWGMYIFRIGATNDVIVEAPHPLADEGTSRIAMKIYQALDARALLIAGTHRDANRDGSADVAHYYQTVFQGIHEALNASDTSIVLQVHGFSSSKHPGYPQVVLGSDQSAHTDLIGRLADVLNAAGVSVGVCENDSWNDLCGQTNVQSINMTSGVFIHLELDGSMRADQTSLITALEEVLFQ